MIPSSPQFANLPRRNCFHCNKPLTFPCSYMERNGVTISFHADCIHPFRTELLDDLLRIKGQHPDQLKEWDFAVKKESE